MLDTSQKKNWKKFSFKQDDDSWSNLMSTIPMCWKDHLNLDSRQHNTAFNAVLQLHNRHDNDFGKEKRCWIWGTNRNCYKNTIAKARVHKIRYLTQMSKKVRLEKENDLGKIEHDKYLICTYSYWCFSSDLFLKIPFFGWLESSSMMNNFPLTTLTPT